jgi:hypothetical protein
MPPLPAKPGLYLWQRDEVVVYIGQTGTPLARRLGSNGYATIYAYNTLAKEAGRKNGGQQTNCRVNALANDALSTGSTLKIWYRVCSPKSRLPRRRSGCSDMAYLSGTVVSNGHGMATGPRERQDHLPDHSR